MDQFTTPEDLESLEEAIEWCGRRIALALTQSAPPTVEVATPVLVAPGDEGRD